MPDIINIIFNFFSETFFNPQKRVYLGYLFCALVIAVVWLTLIKQKSVKASLSILFSKEIWLSYSAKTDYVLLVLNKIIMSFISPILIGQVVIATFWFETMHKWLVPESGEDWPKWLIMTLFTLTLFLLDDSSKYFLHRCLHKSHILWRFHRVHHSATNLTPLTIFRSHPVEGVLFVIRSAIVQGISIGVFVFLFGSQVDLVSVLGLNLLIFIFNVFGANLRHSHVAIHYPKCIEKWLMSPAQHHIHHSIESRHYDKNFGVVLTIWDRLGHSFHYSNYHSNQGLDHTLGGSTALQFGIIENKQLLQQSIWELYLMPFVDVFRIILNKIKYIMNKFRILLVK